MNRHPVFWTALGLVVLIAGCGATRSSPRVVSEVPRNSASSTTSAPTPTYVNRDDLAKVTVQNNEIAVPFTFDHGLVTFGPPSASSVSVTSAQAVQTAKATGLYPIAFSSATPIVGLADFTSREIGSNDPATGTFMPKYVAYPVWIVAFHSIREEYAPSGAFIGPGVTQPPSAQAIGPSNVVFVVDANANSVIVTLDNTIQQAN